MPSDGTPGKKGKVYPTVEEQRAFWRTVNGCSSTPDETKREGDMEAQRWNACTDGTALWAIHHAGLGHNWPSKARGGFDGGRVAWTFFFDR